MARDDADPMTAHEKTRREPIDRSVMTAITAGDERLERELFRQFRKVNDEDAALLRSGVVAGDVALALHSAHRVKGAARWLGARGLALACDRLERAARGARPVAMGAVMPMLESELHRVNMFLYRLETRRMQSANAAGNAAQCPGGGDA